MVEEKYIYVPLTKPAAYPGLKKGRNEPILHTNWYWPKNLHVYLAV
jgi:hypothetical protein